MKRKAVLRAVILALGWGLVASLPALSDDSAAAIAAGGLVARRETRIVMAREVLQISVKKIVVDYDFRNDTNQDVTTEVAFPVPPYDHSEVSFPASISSFSDFQLSVNGKPVPFKPEAKANLKGKDITGILKADGIDIASFGHLEDHEGLNTRNKIPDLIRLPEGEQKRLVAMGLFDVDKDIVEANWEVHLQYHWTQTFPSHSTVHIRHEYSPVVGFATLYGEGAAQQLIDAGKIQVNERKPKPLNPDDRGDLKSFCLGLPLAKNMAATFHQQSQNVPTDEDSTPMLLFDWVDFILTSANTWKRPIEDFTLIIERPKPEHGGKVFINFCPPANGEVEKTDVDLFQVHLTNFVPVSELHIGFFEVPQPKAAQPAMK